MPNRVMELDLLRPLSRDVGRNMLTEHCSGYPPGCGSLGACQGAVGAGH